MIQDVIVYESAIVDNTNRNKRIVILTDKKKPYKQVFCTDEPDFELIRKCKFMRNLGVESY